MKSKICHIKRDSGGNITHRRFINPKTATISLEGTRSPDNMEFTTDIIPQVKEDDEIYYIQDIAAVDNLVGIYNFYGNFRDESGFEQDDVRTSNIDLPECVDQSGSNNIYEKLRLRGDAIGEFVESVRKKYLGFYKMKISASSNDGVKMEKKFLLNDVSNEPIINLSGEFEIWMEFTSDNVNTNQTLLDFYDEVSNKGLLIQRDMSSNQIIITANDGGTANVSVGTFTNDTILHMMRFIRVNGVFKLYLDNNEVTITNSSYSGNMNNTIPYWYMAKRYNESTSTWSDGFSGYFFQLRFYSAILLDEDVTNIWTSKAQQTTMKFGGFVWKIEDGITKRMQCKGWSAKILTKIISPSTLTSAPSFSEVTRDGTLYKSGNSHAILKDIIYNIGENEYSFTTDEPSGNPLEYTWGSFNTYGNLLDLMEFLMIANSDDTKKFYFSVLPRKVIIIDQLIEGNLLCNDHTSNILEYFYDDTKTTNMLEISANNSLKHDTYSRSVPLTSNVLSSEYIVLGYDNLRIYQADCLVDTLISATINGVTALIYNYDETIPSGSYGVKLSKDRSKFQAQAPLNGTYVVKLWFSFKYFIYGSLATVRVISDNNSVNTIGVYPKRLIVRQLEDGINLNAFGLKYLTSFKDVKLRVKVRFNGIINSVTIGQKLPVWYITKKLYSAYDEVNNSVTPLKLPVSSITYKYPEGITIVELGDNEYNTFDLEKITVDALRGLDNNLNKSTLI